MTRKKIVGYITITVITLLMAVTIPQLKVAQAQNYPTFARNACAVTSGLPCYYQTTCSLAAATTCSATFSVPATSVCSADLGGASDTSTGVGIVRATLSATTATDAVTMSGSQTTTAGIVVDCL